MEKQLVMLRLFIDAQSQLLTDIESKGSISVIDAATMGLAICNAAQITRNVLATLEAMPAPKGRVDPNLN